MYRLYKDNTNAQNVYKYYTSSVSLQINIMYKKQ